MSTAKNLCAAVAIVMLSACQSAQKTAVERQIIPADSEAPLARQLDVNIEKAYGAWSDETAHRILDGLVSQILSSDPGYKGLGPIKVHVLATTTPYIAPGILDSIYISRGALAGIAYENELVFVLATEIALVKDRATSRNLAALRGQDVGQAMIGLPTAPAAIQRDYLAGGWFEGGGLFDFGSVEYLRAEQEGVRLAYVAKYDPRGAVTLIQKWTSPPFDRQTVPLGKILPEPVERLASARAEVAKLSPLRDPIVTSRTFEDLMSRLEVKKAKSKSKAKAKAGATGN